MSDIYKYIKYKTKYLKIMDQYGGAASKILLDGNSSTGKTTISKYYEKKGYTVIAYDDYRKRGRSEFFRTAPNEYISKKDFKQTVEDKTGDLMYEESKKHSKVLFDLGLPISQIDKTIFVVTVYAPLDIIIRNMISRRTSEYRTSSDVFQQFTDRYVKLETSRDSIDIINRKKFIENLKQMKNEFESENQLIDTANKMFADMNIYDDEDHPITLRDNHKSDYVINIYNKTPEEIYEEIKLASEKI